MVHWIRLCATPLFALAFVEGAAIADDLRVVVEGEWTEEAVLSRGYLDTYSINTTGIAIDGAFELDLVLPEDHQLDELGETGQWIMREWRTLLGEPAGQMVAARSIPIEAFSTLAADSTWYLSVVLSVSENPEEWFDGLSSGVGFWALVETCSFYCVGERTYSAIEHAGWAYGIDGSVLADRPGNEYHDQGVPTGGDIFYQSERIVVMRYFDVLSIRVVPEPQAVVLAGFAFGACGFLARSNRR